MACACSNAAKKANKKRSPDNVYIGFALHYYGECYGRTQAKIGELTKKGTSHRCIGDQTYTNCENKHTECVGRDHAEYIYKLREDILGASKSLKP